MWRRSLPLCRAPRPRVSLTRPGERARFGTFVSRGSGAPLCPLRRSGRRGSRSSKVLPWPRGEPLRPWWFFRPRPEAVNSFDAAQRTPLAFLPSSAPALQNSRLKSAYLPRAEPRVLRIRGGRAHFQPHRVHMLSHPRPFVFYAPAPGLLGLEMPAPRPAPAPPLRRGRAAGSLSKKESRRTLLNARDRVFILARQAPAARRGGAARAAVRARAPPAGLGLSRHTARARESTLRLARNEKERKEEGRKKGGKEGREKGGKGGRAGISLPSAPQPPPPPQPRRSGRRAALFSSKTTSRRLQGPAAAPRPRPVQEARTWHPAAGRVPASGGCPSRSSGRGREPERAGRGGE